MKSKLSKSWEKNNHFFETHIIEFIFFSYESIHERQRRYKAEKATRIHESSTSPQFHGYDGYNTRQNRLSNKNVNN